MNEPDKPDPERSPEPAERPPAGEMPRGPVFDHYLFEKARSLQQGGHHGLAEECYRKLLDRDPRSFKALNNLGVLFEAQGRMVEAEWAYRRALEIAPRTGRIHFNLGHALQADGRIEQAERAYRRSIELEPGSFAPHFNLGRLLHDLERFAEAETCYREAVRIDEASAGAHSCLGEILYQQGRLPDALMSFMRAVDADPEVASEHFNLGKTLEGLGKLEDAVTCYRRSLELQPTSVVARENLVRGLERLGRGDEARQVLTEWLELVPGEPTATHLLAALSGETPDRPSDSYLRDTFDRFAPEFDETLRRLDYRAPELVVAALAGRVGPPAASLDVLDAGCGTGLCGPLLRPYARTLIGVDLSPGMIARARARGGYDELGESELTLFLKNRFALYDAIVSADTLCYLGDLEPVLAAMARSLRPGGTLVFTVEALEGPAPESGFRLNPTGRYGHSEEYVRRALAEAAFARIDVAAATLRREAVHPVTGWVVTATRAAGPG